MSYSKAMKAGIPMLLALAAGNADAAQREVVKARISPRCTVEADVRRDEREACWRLVCGSGRPARLGCDLTAMHQIVSLSASPDRRHLAVISVGEGHPILELVDLPVLLKQHRYSALCTVNPFPGTLDAGGWSASGVLIDSDVPLNVESPEARAAGLTAVPRRFAMSAADCRIMPVTPAADDSAARRDYRR
ncbi:MAG: hypothetical protein EPN21_11680 [Methylococcaceae bacterium]|nr:MAG: hypothetical protein EPN21_11680 [Methylococcaceae bacterium]